MGFWSLQFSCTKVAVTRCSAPYYIPYKHLPFYYDPEDDDEVIEMENEADRYKDADDEDDEFVEFLQSWGWGA